MTITLPEPYDLPQTGLAQTLFGGIGQGILSHAENKEKLEQALELEKQKQKMKMEGVQNLLGSLGLGGEAPPQQGNSFGSQGTPPPSNQQQMSQLEKIATNPKAMLEIAALNKPLADQIQQMYGNLLKERKINLQKEQHKSTLEQKRENLAEPELIKIYKNLESLENEEMRFSRLSDLFSPELESKFPSGFTTALFSKNGELRPAAFSQLSDEAQESVKLITDQILGAKETFGARVTNFDLQTYLKRLPSLLNSPNGRRRVLRDLRMINKLNRLHDEKTLEIIEEGGGAGKMPLSKAKAIFRKRYKDEVQALRQEFINPNKKTFSSLEDIDPSLYNGQRFLDEETGQIFKSNGKELIPEK